MIFRGQGKKTTNKKGDKGVKGSEGMIFYHKAHWAVGKKSSFGTSDSTGKLVCEDLESVKLYGLRLYRWEEEATCECSCGPPPPPPPASSVTFFLRICHTSADSLGSDEILY